ncbi:hypothetical protein SAMIE_1023960 [Sphingobium amiense]|uniref:Glycerophosphoryl diester phosphodiesterase membrane domain-containing protein n=1 Tax=Sphingobium amiense TaxID=135719 RepID=A0A494WDU0_9SPHN|nr:hypothetical protein [Sphingobium amiense]BBD98895.1 hypothetical protein SAMIE_1023960 [Sphingobium amiense]
MATLSIGKAWEEAVAFVAREAALLLPVALLFVALPIVLLQEMTPPELVQWSATMKGTMPAVPPSYWLSLTLAILLIWFGSLTLFALALRPGISVAEALRLALHRLPVLIGTSVLAGLLLFVIVILVSAPLILLGGNTGAVIAMVGVGLFVGTRLALLNPVVIDDHLGVLASLRRAWALTKGGFWRLLGFIAIVLVVSTIAGSAAQAVFGVIGGLVAGVDGARLAGGIAAAGVSGVVQVYMLVMLARLYRQAAD